MFKEVKRIRAGNFTSQERSILIEIIEANRYIVENKVTNAVNWKRKEEAWKQIAREFNALNTSHRTAESLKLKWEGINKSEKKLAVVEKKEVVYSTGGGKAAIPTTQSDSDIVRSIMSVSLQGLTNPYDSNRPRSLPAAAEGVSPFTRDRVESEGDEEYEGEPMVKGKGSVGDESPVRYQKSQIVIEDLRSPQSRNQTWSSWTPTMMKQPVHPALVKAGAISFAPNLHNLRKTSEEDIGESSRLESPGENKSAASAKSLMAVGKTPTNRRRPVCPTKKVPPLAEAGKRFSILAAERLELVRLEKSHLEENLELKVTMEAREHKLRMKLMYLELVSKRLDIQIKQTQLANLKRRRFNPYRPT